MVRENVIEPQSELCMHCLFFFSSFLLFHPLEFSSCWHLKMWFHLTRSACQRLTTFCSRALLPPNLWHFNFHATKKTCLFAHLKQRSVEMFFLRPYKFTTPWPQASLTRRLPVKVTNQEEEHSASLSGTLYSLSSDPLKSFRSLSLLFLLTFQQVINTAASKSPPLWCSFWCAVGGWDNLFFYEEFFFYVCLCLNN